jgi:hypothetical protein
LYATTRQFLNDLGLSSLDQLPPIGGHGLVPALHAMQSTLLGDGQAALPLEAEPVSSTPSSFTPTTA